MAWCPHPEDFVSGSESRPQHPWRRRARPRGRPRNGLPLAAGYQGLGPLLWAQRSDWETLGESLPTLLSARERLPEGPGQRLVATGGVRPQPGPGTQSWPGCPRSGARPAGGGPLASPSPLLPLLEMARAPGSPGSRDAQQRPELPGLETWPSTRVLLFLFTSAGSSFPPDSSSLTPSPSFVFPFSVLSFPLSIYSISRSLILFLFPQFPHSLLSFSPVWTTFQFTFLNFAPSLFPYFPSLFSPL